jgi:hypothetical protein
MRAGGWCERMVRGRQASRIGRALKGSSCRLLEYSHFTDCEDIAPSFASFCSVSRWALLPQRVSSHKHQTSNNTNKLSFFSSSKHDEVPHLLHSVSAVGRLDSCLTCRTSSKESCFHGRLMRWDKGLHLPGLIIRQLLFDLWMVRLIDRPLQHWLQLSIWILHWQWYYLKAHFDSSTDFVNSRCFIARFNIDK